MTENPEQAVIDQIDALVNESLEHGPTDDYEREYSERCEHCGGEWHGLASDYGCPGAYATPDEQERYRTTRRHNRGHIPIYPRWCVCAWVVVGERYARLDTYYEAFEHSTAVREQELEGYTPIGYIDQVDSVHITQDRPTSPNSVTQCDTTQSSWTLTDLARMRERAWLTRTYDQTPTFDMPEQSFAYNAYITHINNWRCSQCQRTLTTHAHAHQPEGYPPNTYAVLCDECHTMQRNARQRMAQAIDTLTHGHTHERMAQDT